MSNYVPYEATDEYEGEGNYKADEMLSNKKNMPVKAHMRKIEDIIAELKTDLNNNKKNGNLLRADQVSLEHKSKEKCNEITKCIMDDLYNFDKDFKRVLQNDKTESDFFKQQINSLNQDKIKLQQNVINLESKLRTCETDIGIDYN